VKVTDAEAHRLATIANAEAEYRQIVAKAEAKKLAKIYEGEGLRDFLLKRGEGKAFETREQKLAEAEGQAEKIRQLSTALAQRHFEDDKLIKLLESMLRGEESRQLMSSLMQFMRPSPVAQPGATKIEDSTEQVEGSES
jgi:regulator of protease activity HflC (stomatin/prohibitin superfamily)